MRNIIFSLLIYFIFSNIVFAEAFAEDEGWQLGIGKDVSGKDVIWQNEEVIIWCGGKDAITKHPWYIFSLDTKNGKVELIEYPITNGTFTLDKNLIDIKLDNFKSWWDQLIISRYSGEVIAWIKNGVKDTDTFGTTYCILNIDKEF